MGFVTTALKGAGTAIAGAFAPEAVIPMIAAEVVPAIIDALRRHGPSDEAKQKIQGILDSSAMQLSQQTGIPLEDARKRVEAEMGPQLEKGFSENPSVMENLLT